MTFLNCCRVSSCKINLYIVHGPQYVPSPALITQHGVTISVIQYQWCDDCHEVSRDDDNVFITMLAAGQTGHIMCCYC